jgi:hypothetical protein
MTIWRAATNQWAGFTRGCLVCHTCAEPGGFDVTEPQTGQKTEEPSSRQAPVTPLGGSPTRPDRPSDPPSASGNVRVRHAAQASPPTATAPTVALPQCMAFRQRGGKTTPDSNKGAQRVSSRKVRSLRTAPSPLSDRDCDDGRGTAGRGREPQVVIVVGPVGSATADYNEARTGSPSRPRATAPGR